MERRAKVSVRAGMKGEDGTILRIILVWFALSNSKSHLDPDVSRAGSPRLQGEREKSGSAGILPTLTQAGPRPAAGRRPATATATMVAAAVCHGRR